MNRCLIGRVSVDPNLAAEIVKHVEDSKTAGADIKHANTRANQKKEKVIERNDMRPFKLEYDKSEYVRNTNQAQFNVEVHSIAPPRYESVDKHFFKKPGNI